MASKNQQELLKFLGSEYSMKEIDLELCIYRKINSRYDIEISGTHRKNHPISVYVWDISNGDGISATMVEKHFDISNWTDLKNIAGQSHHEISGFSLIVSKISFKSSRDRLFSSIKDLSLSISSGAPIGIKRR